MNKELFHPLESMTKVVSSVKRASGLGYNEYRASEIHKNISDLLKDIHKRVPNEFIRHYKYHFLIRDCESFLKKGNRFSKNLSLKKKSAMFDVMINEVRITIEHEVLPLIEELR